MTIFHLKNLINYNREKLSEDNSNNPEDKENASYKSDGEFLDRGVIDDEMKKSYLDYAMSVIVSRALPDIRDGLASS